MQASYLAILPLLTPSIKMMTATKMRQTLEKAEEPQQWVRILFNLDIFKSIPPTLSHSLLFPFHSSPILPFFLSFINFIKCQALHFWYLAKTPAGKTDVCPRIMSSFSSKSFCYFLFLLH